MTVLGRRNVSAVALLAALLCGCGMKGPPLAPFVRVPAPVTDLVVQRLGDEVSVGFVLPTENEDRSEPASLVRVDVYAMTTRPRLPPDRTLELEEFQEAAALVASVEVAPPPLPEPESDGETADEPSPAEPPPAESSPAEPPADAPVMQGAPVMLSEVLTAEVEVPVDPWEEERARREEAEEEAREDEEEDDTEEPERPVMVPLMTPPLPGPLQREYVVVHVSEDGEESEGGERIAVPLGVRAPEPPPAPEVVYTETTVDVTWELPPGARETVQAPVTAEDAADEDAADEDAADEDAADEDAAAEDAADEDAADEDAADEDAAAEDAADEDAADAPVSDEAPADAAPADEASAAEETPPEAAAEASIEAEPADAEDETDAQADDAEAPADDTEAPAAPLTPLESRPIVEWPPASTYELFEVSESDAGSPDVPEPLSQTPLAAPAYTDQQVEYGVERCFAVRTLDVVVGFEVRSRLSPATCVTFVDTFPPAAPQALTAVGSQGEVSLLWRPNDEADLAGYLVLRGLPGDETLHPLMDAPLTGNTYRDTTAEPGVRHAYAVRAVDTAATPNPSEPSDRVEAAAR